VKDWFSWNSVKSTDYGIHITTQPSVIRPSERAMFTNVPARSGSLTMLEADDVYSDFILPVECVVKDMSRIHEIGAWLKGAGTLRLAARPGGFFYARVANQIEFAKVLRNHEHRTFTINFRCQPFWYAEAVPPITLTTSGSTITNPGNVPSDPVITVYGSGEITLMVGQTIVELEGVSGSITLDTPLMEAYSGTTSLNGNMGGDFPLLKPGMNAISWSGSVIKVEVRPNWRYLL
jgi:phage-related protein